MVKVIMGHKGTGKTKQLIDMVNMAVEHEKGNVICIEHGPKMTIKVDYRARLVNANDYHIGTFDFFKGFLSGMIAGNYDISHIFIDSLYKIAMPKDNAEVESFLEWLTVMEKEHGVQFTLTISADIEEATEGISKFF